MKRIYIVLLLLISSIFLISCGKKENDVVTSIGRKLDDTNSYYAEAVMNTKQHNVSRTYNLKVHYKDAAKYKVELTNTTTKNTQIIIKNNDGVYVLTPSLNKSFKFNSNWPFNGSHSYLFESLVKDIVNDESPHIETTNDEIIITVAMNDSIQEHLASQRIVLDKESLKPKEVTLYDQSNVEVTKITFSKFDFNPDISDTEFEIKKTIDEDREDKGVSAPVGRQITYPTYIPTGSQLVAEDVKDTRAMMTFGGTNGFTVIQEFVDDSTSVSTTNVIGDLVVLSNGLGAISSSSITWVQNGVEFMVFSDTLSKNELIKIANSFIMGDEK